MSTNSAQSKELAAAQPTPQALSVGAIVDRHFPPGHHAAWIRTKVMAACLEVHHTTKDKIYDEVMGVLSGTAKPPQIEP